MESNGAFKREGGANLRSSVRAHRCPECDSLNEKARFSRRTGGITCEMCGSFDAMSPQSFHPQSVESTSPLARLPARGLLVGASAAAKSKHGSISFAQQARTGQQGIRLCSSRPQVQDNLESTDRRIRDSGKKRKLIGVLVPVMLCSLCFVAWLGRTCRLSALSPLLFHDRCAPVPEGALGRWRKRLGGIFSRVK